MVLNIYVYYNSIRTEKLKIKLKFYFNKSLKKNLSTSCKWYIK
jgi:hypothetical protein